MRIHCDCGICSKEDIRIRELNFFKSVSIGRHSFRICYVIRLSTEANIFFSFNFLRKLWSYVSRFLTEISHNDVDLVDVWRNFTRYICPFIKCSFLPRPWLDCKKLEWLPQNRVCPTWILSRVKADRLLQYAAGTSLRFHSTHYPAGSQTEPILPVRYRQECSTFSSTPKMCGMLVAFWHSHQRESCKNVRLRHTSQLHA